ncbi:MAG: hypothetical protein V4507_10695 [Verrucomicrobiota bacterium]
MSQKNKLLQRVADSVKASKPNPSNPDHFKPVKYQNMHLVPYKEDVEKMGEIKKYLSDRGCYPGNSQILRLTLRQFQITDQTVYQMLEILSLDKRKK